MDPIEIFLLWTLGGLILYLVAYRIRRSRIDAPSTRDTIRDLRAQVRQLEAQLRRCEAEKDDAKDAASALAEMEARKDAAYLERNRCVALIARMALASGLRACVARTAIEGWSDDWHGCVYVDLPTGQASWHFHDSQAHLFAGIPEANAVWDGHSTDEKYRRVDAAFQSPNRMGATPHHHTPQQQPDGFYWVSKADGSERCLVKLYTHPDTGERGIGYGYWDGAGFLPLRDLVEDTVLVPALLGPTTTEVTGRSSGPVQ